MRNVQRPTDAIRPKRRWWRWPKPREKQVKPRKWPEAPPVR